MTEYTGIQGQNILITATDPANPTEGQIWYNSTSNLLKGYANAVINAFASGGNLNTARFGLGNTGTQTAALAFGGSVSTGSTGATESYNGTSWTTLVATMGTARFGMGFAGTQTAALSATGRLGPGGSTSASESWNGSSWTTIPATLNTARFAGGSAGTQTAALFFGGYSPYLSVSESYNGTSWTNTPSLNTARSVLGGAGS